MAAIYDGLEFRTALEAHWAAFFDLAGWNWWYHPAAIGDWKPDFRVRFPCGHSECGGHHTLLVSVIPATDLHSLKDHPSLRHAYGNGAQGERIPADAGALFGANPAATTWEMAHGAGGGVDTVAHWVDQAPQLWLRAGESVRI